jgi:hypothetical protein
LNSEFADLNKLKLKATLFSNLLLLKEVMPSLYKEFNGYSPESNFISVNETGDVNLTNNGDIVYPKSAERFAEEQVEQFLNRPEYYRYKINHQDDKDMVFKHAAVLKSIYNVRVEEAGNEVGNPANENRLDFVCMLGGGLGYQIPKLFKKKDILNFFLFEPNKDTFFALLHCIELRPLFEYCIKVGGQFVIRVGGSPDGVINEISKLLFKQGHFNLSRVLFFTHYESESIAATKERIKEIGHRWSNGWGFMEDEIISMSHTLSNLKAGSKVIKNKKHFINQLENKPVFICANGPSLDMAIDFLKENQEHVIIISAGTALKSLLVNAIKPDIHIEAERTAGLIDWVEVVERTEGLNIGLKDLRIIALNTVYNEILSKFKSSYLLGKINDAGGRLMSALDSSELYTFPEFSNPTVSNTALAVAGELGFKNIYLCGTDFGFVSEEKHHSKDSIYFDSDFKFKESTKKSMQGELVVKGNFRESVLATSFFDLSKGNVELYLQANPQIQAKNTADGAFIRLAIPMRINEIELDDVVDDKAVVIENLLNDATSLEQLSVRETSERITEINKALKEILEQLLSITNQYFDTREQLADAFTAQNKVMQQLKSSVNGKVIFWTIQGTFRYLQAYIMTNSYYYKNLVKRAEFMNACVGLFHEHVDDLYREYIAFHDKPSHV